MRWKSDSARIAIFGFIIACTPVLFAAAIPQPADYDVYHATVTFKTLGAHKIGIVLTDERALAGGYVHLFRFWSDQTIAPLNVTAASASVEYRGRELVIILPEQQLFYEFVLSDAAFSSPPPPSGFAALRYAGFGLNHEVRPVGGKKSGNGAGRSVSISDSSCTDFDCYFQQDPGNGSGTSGTQTCDSGGPGAVSCSTTNGSEGCSIACAAGYYACCQNGWAFQPAHCFCVRG